MKVSFKDKIFFTPIGFAFLAAVLVILIRSLLARNAYEIALSSAALLFMLVTGIIGFWKSRKLAALEVHWKPPFPMTAAAGEKTLVSGLAADIPLFFRLHFKVRGRFFPCGDMKNFNHEPHEKSQSKYYSFSHKNSVKLRGLYSSVETSVPRGETSVQLPLDFPMSGNFQGEGFCRLRDIFGFFSFACGTTQRRTVNVRSAPCFGKDYYVNAQSGAEDRRNKHSSDEERYYMREYTPGDRFRDINWKSSEKIDALITRISPDNQEKISRIEVHFRNYLTTGSSGQAEKPSIEALWLLDRAKARLSHFLRSLLEQQSSFVFDVRAAQKNWEIENEQDLDAFLEELAGLSFAPLQNETAVSTGAKNTEIYVFSTACDLGLPSFLLINQMRPVSLFLAQPLGTRGKGLGTRDSSSISSRVTPRLDFKQQSSVPEILYKRDFLLKGCIPLPRWLFSSKIKPLYVQANKTEIIYAGTKL